MADAAAPSAPAGGGANVSTSSSSSAPASAGGAAPAAKGPAAAPGVAPRPRTTAGQFAPKDGSQVAPDDAAAAPAEPVKDPYRFKRKLKVYGNEEDVDLDEDGIARELQKKRALEKKLGEYDTTAQRARRLLELAEKDPEKFLRELKKDPDQWAREKLAREARRESMTPEEREVEELREFKSRTEQEREQAKQQAEAERKNKLRATLVEKNQTRFIEALKGSDLPKTYESLYYITETARLALDEGVELSDAELARETARRLDTLTDRYLGQLDGKALIKKLGAKRIQAILEARVAEFDAQQNFEAPAPAAPAEAAPAADEFIDGAEVDRRIREMRNGSPGKKK